MDDTISRAAAIDAVAKALKGTFVEYEDIAEKIINKVPSADRKGHWIKHGEPPWYVIECSECGAKWQMSGSWDANNFCGNCGADMRGGEW